MMVKYEIPEAEVLVFAEEDVIRTSEDPSLPDKW